MSKGKGWIDVVTTKRSYSARGDAKISWERDEEVVSIEPRDDGKNGNGKNGK